MTKKCPYCQSELEELNKATGRTQHSHQRDVRSGDNCPDCGYETYTETTVMDRGGRMKQVSSSQDYEQLPAHGVMTVAADDHFVQQSNICEDKESLQEYVNRANDIRKQEGYDTVYIIRAGPLGKSLKMDGNHYDDDSLEDDAKFRIDDDGLEKLTGDPNDV